MKPASPWSRAWLGSSVVVLALASGACGGDDIPEVTSFGPLETSDTSDDTTAGVSTFDPDSTDGMATMGGDATQGSATDASTTDAPTTDASTTDAPTTDAPTSTDGGAECGNGMIEVGEDCESEDVGGQDCTTLGFAGGVLSCTAECAFDVSQCSDCGNGAIDGTEQCDGADLGGSTCLSEGFDGGELACAGDCSIDTSSCTMVTCGNGALDAGEACDGADLDGQTCVSQGFAGGGVLACSPACNGFDTSGCFAGPMCGNAAIEAGEVCDGGNLGGQTCATLGFAGGGVLACSPACNSFNTAGCIVGPVCGNAAIEAPEVCDGVNLGGQTCVSQGFAGGGVLACNAGCGSFNTAGCIAGPTCGDGVIAAPEVCDGANLGGQTCVSQGFPNGGILACNPGCGSFNTAGCNMVVGPVCGNGAIEVPEACDGANLGGQTCASVGFLGGGVLACAPDCSVFNTSGCIVGPVCGNGAVEAPEVCDGASLNGQTCVSQGFAGGGVLACNAGCGSFNTAGCIPGGGGCIDQDINNATGPGVAAGNTAGSDDDIGPSCGGTDGNDHVVEFTAAVAGNYTFDTFGSGYDTKLALYSNCMTEISCNDDANGGLQSQLVLNMAAGQTVLVVVDGFNGLTGNFVLNITAPGGGGCAHPLCQTGVALVNGCNACVSQICAVDAFCCTNSWDGICVDEVTSVCGLACPGV